jgi:hypothetical protein
MSRVFASTLGRNQGKSSESHAIEGRSTDTVYFYTQRRIHYGGRFRALKRWSSRLHAD